MTTRIEVPEYIRRWMLATYRTEEGNILVFSERDDLYHIIADVLARRPESAPMIDRGNLEFRLPSPRYGKNPRDYNYIPAAGVRYILKRLKSLFYIAAHEFIYQKERTGRYTIREAVMFFMIRYDLDGTITEDAIVKDFQRWRKKFCRHRGDDILTQKSC